MSRFFALSRTTHGVLDIAAPAYCALLWLGGFPRWQTTALSLFTAFAGYCAIYALNDLVGLRSDLEKFTGARVNRGYAVDSTVHRHPVAQGALSMKSAMVWTAAWFVLALVGSYLLRPVIVLVLLAAAALEVAYCRLLKITHLRTVLGGLVKTSGPIAAVLVVDPNPSPFFLVLLLAWLFPWEIGGQNIPSDWNDTLEDRRVRARTIPIRFGFEASGRIILIALALSVAASAFLPLISPRRLGALYVLVSLLLGYVLLLRPGLQLYRLKEGGLAARLFDRASYYPLAHLALICAFLLGGVPRAM
jgi:4-hydroxybenzoate polyprenyltransferase